MLDGISMGTPVSGATNLGGSGSGGSGGSGGSSMASTFAEIFKMDYDQFKQSVSQEFRKASEDILAMNKMLEGKAEPLLSQRDWMGLGQQKFREEWESKIHPVLQRLQQALAEAANLAAQMEEIVHKAEQESSAVLGTWRE